MLQVKPQQMNDSSKYLLEVFHDPLFGISLDVDAEHFGNETRFINDFKSVRPEPNVEFLLRRLPVTGELSVGVVTRQMVRRGEELLADYGSKFWKTSELKSEKLSDGSQMPRHQWESPQPKPRSQSLSSAQSNPCTSPLKSFSLPSRAHSGGECMASSVPLSVTPSPDLPLSTRTFVPSMEAAHGFRCPGRQAQLLSESPHTHPLALP